MASLESEDWMVKGTCYVEKAPPEIFIPEQGVTSREARSYCARCAYRKPCLDYALRTGSVGVWGGVVLQLSNRDEVTLLPIAMMTDLRPVEHLENPPPVAVHQNPFTFL